MSGVLVDGPKRGEKNATILGIDSDAMTMCDQDIEGLPPRFPSRLGKPNPACIIFLLCHIDAL